MSEIEGVEGAFNDEAAEAIRRRRPLPPVPDECYPPDAVELPETTPPSDHLHQETP